MIKKLKIKSMVSKSIILDVPYHSQYLELNEKDLALKSCGITSVYMILDYFSKVESNSLEEITKKAIKEGGLGPSGWKHDYFVQLFKNFGLKSYRMESMRDSSVEKIRENIEKSNPVIISAERRLFDQRIFHMVVITGIKINEKNELEGFYYHDPASLQSKLAKNIYVPLKTFFLSWRKMAIFVEK